MNNVLAAYLGGGLVRLLSSTMKMFDALGNALPPSVEKQTPLLRFVYRTAAVFGFLVSAVFDAVFWPIKMPADLYRSASAQRPTDEEILGAAAQHFTAMYGKLTATSMRQDLVNHSYKQLMNLVRERLRKRNGEAFMERWFE